MRASRSGSHTVSRLTVHLVWATKYRYHVLVDEVKPRCRELLIQICNAEDVRILKGRESGSCSHACGVPTSVVGERSGQTIERTDFPDIAKRISPPRKTILGTALVGSGIRCVEYWEHHRGDGAGLFRASSERFQSRAGHVPALRLMATLVAPKPLHFQCRVV